MNRMDQQLVDDFATNGAVVIRHLVSQRWLDELADGVEYNRAHPSGWSHWYTDANSAVGFWTDYVTWPHVEQYRRVVFDSGLATVAGELMSSRTVRFFHEHVLVKEPGASERTPWHHDEPYYGIDGARNVSMWIALDPVPASSGLRFVAGSHRWDRLFVPRRFIDHEPYLDGSDVDRVRRNGGPGGTRYEIVPDIDAEIDGHRVLSWDIEPGDVIAFHFRTLHDAPGNDLPTRRRAVSLRWLGDDATFGTRPWVTSPPFEPDGLVVGGPLDGDPRFPLVVG
jgi:ectoine hydroxylase-related dioxygenase (phytanoyl-CoA dioxygenase family)